MVISRLVLQAALVQVMSARKPGSTHKRLMAAGRLPAIRCCENMVLQYRRTLVGIARNSLALDMKTAAADDLESSKAGPVVWLNLIACLPKRIRFASPAAAALVALGWLLQPPTLPVLKPMNIPALLNSLDCAVAR